MQRAVQPLETAIQGLCRLCGLLAALIVVALALLVALSIASRAIGVYVPGLTDYAAYCLASAGTLGMAYTFGQRGHIRVALLVDLLRGRARYWLEVSVLALATAMAGYLAFYLVRMTYVSWIYKDRSDGSDEILIWIPQAPFAFGACLFALVLLLALARALLRRDLEGLLGGETREGWD